MIFKSDMKTEKFLIALSFYILILSTSLSGQLLPERQWPGFRGYLASGVLDNANLSESFETEGV